MGKTYDVDLVLTGPDGSTLASGTVRAANKKPADLARDTFYGPDGTRLSAHPADVGGPWVEAEETWEIRGGRARDTDTGFGKGLAVLDAGESDVSVRCKLVRLSGANGPMAGLVLRYSGPGNYLLVNSNGTHVRLRRYEDHIDTGLAQAAHTVADNVPFRLRADLNGADVTVYVDDVAVLFVPGVMDWQAATRFGLFYGNENNGGVAWEFDNFAVAPLE